MGDLNIKVNFFYSIVRDESEMRLAVVPHEWFKSWLEEDENFLHFNEQPRNWFNDEVLEIMLQSNNKKLSQCNIWDFDWVKYFELVKGRKPNKNELDKISDKRSKYEKKLQLYIRERRKYPIWVLEFWSYKIVLLLNKLGLYRQVYSWLKK